MIRSGSQYALNFHLCALGRVETNLVLVLGCLRLLDRIRERSQRCLLVPILLHLQVHSCPLARPPSYWVSYRLLSSASTIADNICSGAQIVFRSFIQPVFARYFSGAGASAANLRAKVDSAHSDKAL